jgi:hypothetical protein
MPQPIDVEGARVPDWIRSLVTDAPYRLPSTPSRATPSERDRAQQRAARELRRIIYAAIRRFSESLSFSVNFPGRYRSGPTFDAVLGYLADMDKNFAADSKTLQNRVRIALMSEYEDADAIPLALEFRETAADAILATIIARFENRLRDVGIASNRDEYTRAKVKAGHDSRVGIRTGALLQAIKDRGRVTVKASDR